MPQDLSSLMGSNFDGKGATDVESAPPKKKLKKVGDHWEDEAGVKYADAEGNIALKEDEIPRQKLKDLPSEQAQAAGGAPAQSVMGAFGMEKSTGTAGWAVGDPGQETKQSVMDWQATPTDHKRQEQPGGGGDFQEYVSLTYPNGLSAADQKYLQDRWNSLTDAEKESWLADARKRKK